MIAFVCASYIQTIRAFQMHSQIDGFKQNADLFLLNKMFEDVDVYKRQYMFWLSRKTIK